MIPKIIHYCWFGGNPLDSKAQKCIDSWSRLMPDYEIKRWDETNYDITKIDYVYEAYQAKKWAFVTDVVRLDIIHKFGGIYFDTDVEVIKSFDDFLDYKSFFGLDQEGFINTGLGFGAEANNPFVFENLQYYLDKHFVNKDGSYNMVQCPKITTDMFCKHGFLRKDKFQVFDGAIILDSKVLCPMDFYSGELQVNQQTHSIHWYSMTWFTERDKKWYVIQTYLTRIMGKKIAFIVVHGCKFPGTLVNNCKLYGIMNGIRKTFEKLR